MTQMVSNQREEPSLATSQFVPFLRLRPKRLFYSSLLGSCKCAEKRKILSEM